MTCNLACDAPRDRCAHEQRWHAQVTDLAVSAGGDIVSTSLDRCGLLPAPRQAGVFSECTVGVHAPWLPLDSSDII